MGSSSNQLAVGEGDAALTGKVDWFPRPASIAHVELLEAAEDFDTRTLFQLLSSEDAREWRHKVGVAGRADGSGKPSTRLLASRGFLLKTNLDELDASRDALRTRILANRERGMRARVWHPSKRWALMQVAGGWLPVSICRELKTLRTFDEVDRRLRAWTGMIHLGVQAHHRSGLGLDLNPANFAVEEDGGTLYYLDDELYSSLDLRQIAFAIAARVPEEPMLAAEAWRAWGRALGEMLVTRTTTDEREQIAEEICGYPLAEIFEPARTALVAGLRTERPTLRIGVRSFGVSERVGVIADVHANLPALQSVVRAAKSLGVERFLFLGDAVGYGPHPRECVELLASLAGVFIRGNHDHAIATGRLDVGMNPLARACAEWTCAELGRPEMEWLASLRTEHRDEEWMAVHGAPRDPNRFFAYIYDLTYEENLEHIGKQGITLCFHGHTHVPVVHVVLPAGPTKVAGCRPFDIAPNRPCLVNPGSVGQPRDRDPRAAFALWDRGAARLTFERVHYDVERTLRDIRVAGLPDDLFSRLQQGT